ncbi:hypothetical protein SAY87_030075 [Trapa incisa]|uniref:Uncharacterized protein n=1 Tax=Trapa incisa TaxID=236973 RepID=A0AAN7K8Q9_9MYRT|nr:hypothetical protein SAY87_030075 [Trapa incisa]
MSESSTAPVVETPLVAPEPEQDCPGANPAEEESRANKRRRNCPESLDKLQESGGSCHQQSFTFDTCASHAPQFTPKFGSFKHPEAAAEPAKVVDEKATVTADGAETVAHARLEEGEEKAESANGYTKEN